jgi:transcriptional regulator with XRE-family HTH domain
MADISPTLRQRELGMRLREFRTAKGLTVEEVANELLCSSTKISRAETGARRATLRDVRDLCQVYEVDATTSAELMELAREAREPAWWTGYDDLNITPFIGMEQAATAITCFGMYFFPALLQTEDYAREIIRGIVPKIGTEILGQRVETRMRRQGLLSQPRPPRYRALLDESVLHRHVGGPAVMKAQLQKVLSLMREEKATVQVIPYEAGAYAVVDSNFDYLEFGGSKLPDLVFVEGLVTHLYQERPHELSRYSEALGYLSDVALNPRDSAKKIEKIRDGFAALPAPLAPEAATRPALPAPLAPEAATRPAPRRAPAAPRARSPRFPTAPARTR